MPSILIAEPNRTMFEGIKSILLKMPDLVVRAQATNRRDVFNAVRGDSIDLIVLEPLMDGAMGKMFIQQLTRLLPETPILALTDMDESSYGIQMWRAGLKGFVKKSCTKEELLYAVHRTLSGKTYICAELAEIMLFGNNGMRENSPHAILTEREMDICTRLAHGERVCEIAPMLMLSAKTVSTHKSRAFEKRKISGVAELVRLFADHSYLKIPDWKI